MPVTPEPTTQVTSRAEPITDASTLDGSKGESAVVVEHLTKRFGDRVAVDDVSFEVGYGEVFAFLGPNGAGKTTTVRTLGTLIAPTSGSATVAGIELRTENCSLRERGVTIFLTTHRLEEAERLCHRVAILNSTLRLIGRPDELRDQLFSRSLDVRVRTPLEDPNAVLGGLHGIEGWEQAPSGYTLAVSDPGIAAPQVARALVGAGADILSLAESRRSLEDIYLELIDEDVEAKSR